MWRYAVALSITEKEVEAFMTFLNILFALGAIATIAGTLGYFVGRDKLVASFKTLLSHVKGSRRVLTVFIKFYVILITLLSITAAAAIAIVGLEKFVGFFDLVPSGAVEKRVEAREKEAKGKVTEETKQQITAAVKEAKNAVSACQQELISAEQQAKDAENRLKRVTTEKETEQENRRTAEKEAARLQIELEQQTKAEKSPSMLVMRFNPAANRFSRSAADDGVITDSQTNLQWFILSGYATCDVAERLVAEETTAGGGWSMPTRGQLQTLYDRSFIENLNISPSILTPAPAGSGLMVWADRRDPSSVWYFDFIEGSSGFDCCSNGCAPRRVFAVRSRR